MIDNKLSCFTYTTQRGGDPAARRWTSKDHERFSEALVRA